MLRLPSLQKARDEYYSGDPAFHQLADATDDAVKEHAHAWEVARETGDYSKLLKEGEQATKFVMQPVDRNTWRAFLDRTLLPADSRLRIGPVITPAILFRLSIVSVSGLDIVIKRTRSAEFDGWELAQPDVVDVLDSIDPKIVTELGNLVFDRQRDISGKA